MPARKHNRRVSGFRRTLRAYYAYIFFYDFIFGYAIYTAYFSLQGLSAASIGVLLAVWSVSGLLFELPSGALSDRFDRRLLLILSPLIKAVCFVLWATAGGDAWVYALGFVFWSLGESLCTGTKEALLYEHVHRVRLSKRYEKLVGRERAVYEAGALVGASIGGLMTIVSLEFALWCSVVPLIAASVVAFVLKDGRRLKGSLIDRPEETAAHRPRYTQHFRNAVSAFATQPRLRFLTFYISCGVILLAVFDEFEQLLYLSISIPLWAFGFVGAAFGMMTIVVSSNAHKIKTLTWVGWLFPIVSGFSLMSFGAVNSLFILVPLAIAHAFMIPVDVLSRAEFQKAMGGESRATTTSALTVIIEAVALVLLLAVGALIEVVGVAGAYQIGGGYLVLFGAWSYWRSHQGYHVAAG